MISAPLMSIMNECCARDIPRKRRIVHNQMKGNAGLPLPRRPTATSKPRTGPAVGDMAPEAAEGALHGLAGLLRRRIRKRLYPDKVGRSAKATERDRVYAGIRRWTGGRPGPKSRICALNGAMRTMCSARLTMPGLPKCPSGISRNRPRTPVGSRRCGWRRKNRMRPERGVLLETKKC